MTLRELAGKRPWLFSALGIGMLVAGLAFAIGQMRSGGRPPEPRIPDQAFYTSDDGATCFVDSVTKAPPFDHQGSEAVRACLFTCDGGRHHWIQYLEKYNEAAKKQWERLQSGNSAADNGPDLMSGLLVKKPGSGKWVSKQDPAARAVTEPICPDGMGGGAVEAYLPD